MNDSSQGIKYDSGKVQMELLPLRELKEVAKVLTYGSEKYAPENWKKVPNLKERYAGALLRHFTSYREGYTFDDETHPSQLRHIAQVVCNALFLLWKELEDENAEKEARCSNPPAYSNDSDGKYIDVGVPANIQMNIMKAIGDVYGMKSEEMAHFHKVVHGEEFLMPLQPSN